MNDREMLRQLGHALTAPAGGERSVFHYRLGSGPGPARRVELP